MLPQGRIAALFPHHLSKCSLTSISLLNRSRAVSFCLHPFIPYSMAYAETYQRDVFSCRRACDSSYLWIQNEWETEGIGTKLWQFCDWRAQWGHLKSPSIRGQTDLRRNSPGILILSVGIMWDSGAWGRMKVSDSRDETEIPLLFFLIKPCRWSLNFPRPMAPALSAEQWPGLGGIFCQDLRPLLVCYGWQIGCFMNIYVLEAWLLGWWYGTGLGNNLWEVGSSARGSDRWGCCFGKVLR